MRPHPIPAVQWEKHLAHERAVRDAFVACGNPAPTVPDPEGCVITVIPRIYIGEKFWQSMEKSGHNTVRVWNCQCIRNKEV